MTRTLKAVLPLVLSLAASLGHAQKPALVENVDEKGRTPFQQGVEVICGQSESCSATFAAVPAGYRLVVTHVNMVGLGTSSSVNLYGVLSGGPNIPAYPNQGPFGPYITFVTQTSGGHEFVVDASANYYINAGASPQASMYSATSDSGLSTLVVTITGYLVAISS